MLTGMQTFLHVALLPTSLGVLRISQLTDNSKRLQTQTPQPTVLSSYSESDYHWLVGVLDKLIAFIHRAEDRRVPELIENDYEWAHALLIELVDAVGESDTHPLRPLMEFVWQLIEKYEDKYVPELTKLFPELAKETPIETGSESEQPASSIPKQDQSELAAYAFFSIGYLFQHGNRLEKALAAYDRAIALKPDFVEAYHNRASGLQQLGKYKKAIIDLEQAIGLDPDSAELHYKRGCTKGSSNQSESAIADFDKAIKLNPNYAEAYCCRGLMKSGLGEYKSAIADFDKAIELKLNPDFVRIHYIRGIVNAQFEQYKEAIVDFDEAIRLYPDYAEAYDSRGVVKNLLKRYESAIFDHTTAIDMAPNFAEAYLHRGMVRGKLGDINGAESDLQTALKLAKQQRRATLKASIETGLQQLDIVGKKNTSDTNPESTAKEGLSTQGDKKPRRGGQWKGKVKIAEDFDELPESFRWEDE